MADAWKLSSACPLDTFVELVTELRQAHAEGVLLFSPPDISYGQDTMSYIACGKSFYD